MNNGVLDNYKLLGYKLFKARFGEYIGTRPNGKTIFIDNNGCIIDSDFEYVSILADGVYAIDKQNSTNVINNKECVMQLNEACKYRDGTDLYYLLGCYVYTEHETGFIEVYSNKGKLILRLEPANCINYSINGSKLNICVEDVTEKCNTYRVVTLDTNTYEYKKYRFTQQTIPIKFTSYDTNLYRVDLIGKNSVIAIYRDDTVIFNLDTNKYTEIKGITCKSNFIYNYGYSTTPTQEHKMYIGRNANTKNYCLLDSEGKVTYINSDIKPLICYYDYYTLDAGEKGCKVCIVDSNTDRRSNFYNKVTILSNKKAVGVVNDTLYIITLDTMEEETTNISKVTSYEVHLSSDIICILTEGIWQVYTSDLEYMCTEEEYAKFLCK